MKRSSGGLAVPRGERSRAERRLTPCKALFTDKERSPHSDISLCHILSVSMVFYCFLPGCAGRLRGLELFAGLKDGANTKPVNLRQSRRSTVA